MLRECALCGWTGADDMLRRHCLFGGWPDPECVGHCPGCWDPALNPCHADRLGVRWSWYYSTLDFEVALA